MKPVPSLVDGSKLVVAMKATTKKKGRRLQMVVRERSSDESPGQQFRQRRVVVLAGEEGFRADGSGGGAGSCGRVAGTSLMNRRGNTDGKRPGITGCNNEWQRKAKSKLQPAPLS